MTPTTPLQASFTATPPPHPPPLPLKNFDHTLSVNTAINVIFLPQLV